MFTSFHNSKYSHIRKSSCHHRTISLFFFSVIFFSYWSKYILKAAWWWDWICTKFLPCVFFLTIRPKNVAKRKLGSKKFCTGIRHVRQNLCISTKPNQYLIFLVNIRVPKVYTCYLCSIAMINWNVKSR